MSAMIDPATEALAEAWTQYKYGRSAFFDTETSHGVVIQTADLTVAVALRDGLAKIGYKVVRDDS